MLHRLRPCPSAPTVIGPLEQICGASILMAGGIRVWIRPGVSFPFAPRGTRLTVFGQRRGTQVYADSILPTVGPARTFTVSGRLEGAKDGHLVIFEHPPMNIHPLLEYEVNDLLLGERVTVTGVELYGCLVVRSISKMVDRVPPVAA